MVFNVNSTLFQLYQQSVLLVEETGVPGETYRPAGSHRQTLSHNGDPSVYRVKRMG